MTAGAAGIARGVARALIGLTLLLGLAALAGRLGRLGPLWDALAIVTPQLALLALLAGAVLAALRRPLGSALAVAVALGALLPLAPYLPLRTAGGGTEAAPATASAAAGGAAGSDLRLYLHNLLWSNGDVDAITAQIEAADADVVFLMEYPNAIRAELEARLAGYPHRRIDPSRITMGVALYSRLPLLATEVRRVGETRIPIVTAELEVAGERVRVVGAHPWPPLGRWGALHRAQVAAVATVAADSELPQVVMGDFNTAPWSYALSELMRRAGVRDARRGFGWAPTFRAAPGVWLPLDHVLVSPAWTVTGFEQLGRAGSDHAALVVDLALAGPAGAP